MCQLKYIKVVLLLIGALTFQVLPANGQLFDMKAISSARVRKPFFALKTNMMYDVVTVINLEAEYPIGDRWSVLGEYVTPWWGVKRKQHYLEIQNFNLQGRYWFGDRNLRPLLTGWFAGVYAGGGYFDLEWENKGHQGEFYVSTGLTGGFAHKIDRRGNIRLEYSLGLGYFNTKYHEYHPVFGSDDRWHLIRQRDGKFSWAGPTRFNISLVWMIHHYPFMTKNF